MLGSRVISALRVIHLWPKLGSGRPGATSTMAGVDLHGGTRRHACAGLLWGSGLGSKVPVRVRGTNTSGNEAHAGLCRAAVDPPRQSCSGV